jgi:hypothetical protein
MILDRSWKDRTFEYRVKKEGHLVILKRLVERGLLKNNREFGVIFIPRSVPLILRVIRSMTQLEKLSLSEWTLTLTEDVPKLFRSCPKLTELRLNVVESQEFEMNEELKNELRAGFLRLRLLELEWYIDSWPAILEMFT